MIQCVKYFERYIKRYYVHRKVQMLQPKMLSAFKGLNFTAKMPTVSEGSDAKVNDAKCS